MANTPGSSGRQSGLDSPSPVLISPNVAPLNPEGLPTAEDDFEELNQSGIFSRLRIEVVDELFHMDRHVKLFHFSEGSKISVKRWMKIFLESSSATLNNDEAVFVIERMLELVDDPDEFLRSVFCVCLARGWTNIVSRIISGDEYLCGGGGSYLSQRSRMDLLFSQCVPVQELLKWDCESCGVINGLNNVVSFASQPFDAVSLAVMLGQADTVRLLLNLQERFRGMGL